MTNTEQDMFVLGGIDDQIRPNCTGVTNAEISPCAISIEVRSFKFKILRSRFEIFSLLGNQVNSLGTGVPWEKYDAWRVGDTKLDWYGAQTGQGTYMGTPASGTPMAWTTNVPGKPEYQELNKYIISI
jgi:alpha-amylase